MSKMTSIIEMLQCRSICIKEFDRRKRIIRSNEHRNSTAISARLIHDGIHVVLHIGGKTEIYISSNYEASIAFHNDLQIEISVPEFRSMLFIVLECAEIAGRVLEFLNSNHQRNFDKENIHANRTSSRINSAVGIGSEMDKHLPSPVFRISSPTKSSGLTPSKKKKKKTPPSPLKPGEGIEPSVTATQPTSTVNPCTALSEEQKRIVVSCTTGSNVFFTGGAGTGKSLVLGDIVDVLSRIHGKDAVFVTATTGLAACAIGGVTIHQFAGIRPGDSTSSLPESIKQRQRVRLRWMQARVLIVDEISMMGPSTLELLNAIAQACRDSSRPMGGLQVIFTGDFFQLPPVETGKTRSQADICKQSSIHDKLTQYYHLLSQSSSRKTQTCRFCFQSSVWDQLFDRDHCFVLDKVYRQDDPTFVSLLGAIRWGNTSSNILDALHECVNRPLNCDDGILPTRIFTHRKDVDSLNDRELANLTGERHEYMSVDEGENFFVQMLYNHCPAQKCIRLKIGCQVLLVKSIDPNAGLANGARGVVMAFTSSSKRPIVRFSNGIVRPISKHTFSVSMGGKVVAQRLQIPLILSWGISVHKSQGMSVDRAIVDVQNSFEYGQAYVALSRVRSKEGLSLTHNLHANHIKSHPDVTRFNQNLIDSSLASKL